MERVFRIMLIPHPDKIFIEYETVGDVIRSDTQKRSGLLLAKPKHQGIPDRGTIWLVGENIKNKALKPGVKVIFKFPDNITPQGFDIEGRKCFVLLEDFIHAIIQNS